MMMVWHFICRHIYICIHYIYHIYNILIVLIVIMILYIYIFHYISIPCL